MWTLGAIPVTGTETLSVTARVTQLQTITNTAARQSSAPIDPNALNDGATAVSMPVMVSDLDVTWTGSPTQPVSPGATIVYTATVVNRGPSAASEATLTAPTPAGLTLASVAGACAVLPCALGVVPPGESRVIAISYVVPPSYPGPGPIVATVTATSATDANLANNTATM